jgi:hypothetical protein
MTNITSGGCTCRTICVPRDRRRNQITFVQVHTASLAWAPFNAGCDEPGALSSRATGHDTAVIQQT